MDENGEVIYGDQLMIVYSREILSRKPGSTFIGEVKCSQSLYDDIRKRGGNGIMWKTGHSLIKAKMKAEHAELAGEMSGHMFFADRYYGFDDAMYAGCRLIEIVAKSGCPLSAQLADVPKTVSTPEIRVDCLDELKFDVVARVTAHFRRLYPIIDVDGVRVLFPRGWGLVARVEYAARFGAALRSRYGGIAGTVSQGSGEGRRGSKMKNGRLR